MDEDALGERNIFRAMGNNPDILKSYMLYGTTVWNEYGLGERELELIILTIAREIESKYEWEFHVKVGYEKGVTPEEMRAIGREDFSVFDDQTRTILEYAKAFASNEMTDEISDSLSEHVDDETLVGIGMLSSHYVATAYMLEAFDVPLEEDEFVGWEPTDEDVRAIAED